MVNKKDESKNQIKETSRIETFSDGVFSIAITLLIIELLQNLHSKGGEGLVRLLLDHWESFFAFLLGFLTILICWINHHLVFNYIEKADSKLMWVNAFVLLVVTFTPFPTAILAEYFELEKRYAMAFFGFNYVMMSIAAYSLSVYVYNKALIQENSRRSFYNFIKLYRYSIIYTMLTFIVCFVSVIAAILLYCILFIVFAFPKESSVKLLRKRQRGKLL
jgi:uncharacterized membrane protein